MIDDSVPRGRGLFRIRTPDAPPLVTNVRRLAGAEREPGSGMIATATGLLALLAGGLYYVSFSGQFKYIFAARNATAASGIEAAMLDTGQLVFSLLALGLSRAGKPSRVERALIMVCAGLSALMNYAAADTASPRSVAAYVAAPVFLAIVTDRVVAVIRRYVLPRPERSVWTGAGRAALYLLRFTLDPWATVKGGRRAVLAAAPLPELPGPGRPALEAAGPDADVLVPAGPVKLPASQVPSTKKMVLLHLYRQHEAYGDRRQASRVAAELAPRADLQPGTARTYIYDHLNAQDRAAGGAL
jgi:hypothetical protein